MKKLMLLTLVLGLALGLAAENATAEIKINLGVVTKPGSAQNIAAEKFKELVEKKCRRRGQRQDPPLGLPGQRDRDSAADPDESGPDGRHHRGAL